MAISRWGWVLGAAALVLGVTAGQAQARKRVLLVTHSGGYIHSSVVQAERTLKELGAKNGFDVVCWRFTNDPARPTKFKKKVGTEEQEVEGTALEAYSERFQASTKEPVTAEQTGRITAASLRPFDAVYFYTTGSPVENKEEMAALTDFVKGGKGFLGSHSATDTLYNMPEYGDMIGAYFDGHPLGGKTKVLVEDQRHPITAGLGSSFEISDELYQYRAPYSREKLHILLKLDPAWVQERKDQELKSIAEDKATLAAKVALLEADGKGDAAKALKERVEGRKPGIRRDDNDYAMAWCREYGQGRVFYTALGHQEAVWNDPRYQNMVLQAIRWTTRQIPGDATPSAQLK